MIADDKPVSVNHIFITRKTNLKQNYLSEELFGLFDKEGQIKLNRINAEY
jgi:hypothetical protein